MRKKKDCAGKVIVEITNRHEAMLSKLSKLKAKPIQEIVEELIYQESKTYGLIESRNN